MSIVSTESYVHTILLRPLPRFKMGWPDAYFTVAQSLAYLVSNSDHLAVRVEGAGVRYVALREVK